MCFPLQEYYYAEVQTTHTTYPDGLEVLHFPRFVFYLSVQGMTGCCLFSPLNLKVGDRRVRTFSAHNSWWATPEVIMPLPYQRIVKAAHVL